MLKTKIISGLKAIGYDIRPIDQVGLSLTAVTIARASIFLRLSHMVADLPGTFVECGVGRGESLIILLAILKYGQSQRTLWGFDSFKGFPEPSPEDVNPDYDNHKFIQRGRVSNTSPQFIRAVMSKAGFDESFLNSHMKLVEGFFNQSLSRYDGSPIAFLHIDADLYQSYKDVLTVLFPLIIPGGVVLFDEYITKRFLGAKRAIDEYFGQDAVKLQTDKFSGQTYLVKNF